MRITGGHLGSRRVRAPRGLAVRPTTDRVREALFSILGTHWDGTRVLDLYAGSGVLGLEALSRGASRVVAVERVTAHAAVIARNAADLGVGDALAIVRDDVLRALARLGARGERFDIVLADPPYAEDVRAALLAGLATAGVLAPGAIVVVEHDRRAPGVDPRPLGFTETDRRRYGDTVLTFYRAQAPA
jgi:16S rRNA (guanine(966)-N(2))-methyltransferase RsmD